MKKIVSVILSCILTISLVACGQQVNTTNVTTSISSDNESTHETTLSKENDTDTPNVSVGVSVSVSSNKDTQETDTDKEKVSCSNGSYFFIQSLKFEDDEKSGVKIQLKEKTPILDNFTGYSQQSLSIIQSILSQIEISKQKNLQVCTMNFYNLECEDVRAILSYFWTYYGNDSELYTLIKIVKNKEHCLITINLDVLKQFEEDRTNIYKNIDSVLEQLEDGSDRYILYQISEYISDLIVYTDGYRNVQDALAGKGVCGAYSLLFKMMAERVGIPVDIVTGYVTDGEPGHAWNRAYCNGEYLYYDITALDTDLVKNYCNIQSKDILNADHTQYIGVFYVHMNCVYGEC